MPLSVVDTNPLHFSVNIATGVRLVHNNYIHVEAMQFPIPCTIEKLLYHSYLHNTVTTVIVIELK